MCLCKRSGGGALLLKQGKQLLGFLDEQLLGYLRLKCDPRKALKLFDRGDHPTLRQRLQLARQVRGGGGHRFLPILGCLSCST